MGIQSSVWVCYTFSQEFFYFQILLDIKEYYISMFFYFEFFLDVKEYFIGFFFFFPIESHVMHSMTCKAQE